eukprot:TRINITY_DN1401_c0_g1_i1.p1 TRINITY_DN1401_c0_g1~~TRINITY_DN1401_c0_g1_i1.p1  ORF type:complete len:561 (+),score=122.26 TRINITY_DN1401_c0_g1_i1:93-1775(+)
MEPYLDQEDTEDPANFPETPIRLGQYDVHDERQTVLDQTDATYVPDEIKKFIKDFQTALHKGDLHRIHELYEGEFNRYSEKYYSGNAWPRFELIAQIDGVGNDALFLVLYKEMYYRHLYATSNGSLVQLEARVSSFENYFNLFRYIIESDVDKLDFDLPNQWIWDIIDEFIYQYSEYCKYKSKLARWKIQNQANPASNQEELQRCEFIQANPDIWSTVYVLGTLNALVQRSEIQSLLDQPQVPAAEVLEGGRYHLIRMMGYYSLIGLLRVHTLLGDYHSAIRSIENIDFSRKEKIFAKVTACHTTLFYYTGFVFMMLRRYLDAIKFFTQVQNYINRIKNIQRVSFQYDDIIKKNEQIYHLLAITLSLCPQRIDEVVLTHLRDKLSEKLTRLAQGDLDCYSDMFKYACPKFVPAVTDWNDPDTRNLDALELQRNVFLNEVRQQIVLQTIRSYLSLYSTISVDKLASFMEQDKTSNPEHFRTYLLRLKHKTRQLVWTGGKLTESERVSNSEIDFYISKDMVHVATNNANKQHKSHAQYFVEQIRYINSLQQDLNKLEHLPKA